KSRYLPEQSGPGRWAFAYTVRIENLGSIAAQLRSRHWIITDGNGKREEVKGDGVVGNQPVLRPGEKFEYTSGAVLQTPHGSMLVELPRSSTATAVRSWAPSATSVVFQEKVAVVPVAFAETAPSTSSLTSLTARPGLAFASTSTCAIPLRIAPVRGSRTATA